MNKKKIIYLVLFSLLLGQQIFAGFPQTTFISLLFISSYIIFFGRTSNKHQKNDFKSNLMLIVIFIILGVGVSFIQFFPSYKYLSITNRNEGFTNQGSTTFSYPFSQLATMIFPFTLGNPAKGTYPDFIQSNGSVFWENSGYIGILALMAAAASIYFWKKNKYIRFYFIYAFISLLLMAGKHSPLLFIYSFFPFNLFRVPSRFLLTFVFSLSILSGLFLNEILKNKKNKLVSFLVFLLLIINLGDLYKTGQNYHPLVKTSLLIKKPETAEFFDNFKEKTVFACGMHKNWNEIFFTKGWQEAQKYLYFNNYLWPDINILWNIPSVSAYPNFISRRGKLLIDFSAGALQNKNKDDFKSAVKLLEQNGTNFLIMPADIKIESSEKTQLIKTIKSKQEGISSINIYQLPNAMPFAKIVFKHSYAENLSDYLKILDSPSFDTGNEIISEHQLANYNKTSNNRLAITSKKASKIIISSETKSNSYLVIKQAYLPGWKAYVDGHKTNIYPVNLNQMAILLPKGKHKVEFRYRPEGFNIGLLVTLISIILLILCLCCYSHSKKYLRKVLSSLHPFGNI